MPAPCEAAIPLAYNSAGLTIPCCNRPVLQIWPMLKQNAIPRLQENFPKKPTSVDEIGANLGGEPTTLYVMMAS